MEDLFVNRIKLNKENIDNSKYPYGMQKILFEE